MNSKPNFCCKVKPIEELLSVLEYVFQKLFNTLKIIQKQCFKFIYDLDELKIFKYNWKKN